MAFTHGANDAQKTMGVIALALYCRGQDRPLLHPDLGEDHRRARDRRRHVLGRLADHPHRRAAGSTRWSRPAASPRRRRPALVIFASTKAGYPLSTTHVISGAVIGSGATKRLSAVRWGVAGNIVFAWILTIPAAAVMAAAFYYVGSQLG